MSGESVEVQLARVDEQLKRVLSELKDSKDSRKIQYEAMESLKHTMTIVINRVEGVENKLSAAQPTIEEFITIKHKVVGAGALGKWLWGAGAFLLGIIAASREAILQHMVK